MQLNRRIEWKVAYINLVVKREIRPTEEIIEMLRLLSH